LSFFFYCASLLPPLHSFPTRRSSDLNLLIKDHAVFHEEKAALYQAGLASSPWQHLDDTSTRVNGRNGYCHIVCNPLYTAYFTTEDRKSTRLNSSHVSISYAVFCLKKK